MLYRKLGKYKTKYLIFRIGGCQCYKKSESQIYGLWTSGIVDRETEKLQSKGNILIHVTKFNPASPIVFVNFTH